jgi:hypothetical protein
MCVRYFYYISESKVEMLKNQVERRFALPEISPKIGIGGFSLGIDYKGRDGTKIGIVKETVSLLKRLTKLKMVLPLEGAQELDTSSFYHDEDVWFHGLYSLRASGLFEKRHEEEYVITYVLWRTVGQRIFLLLGSPLNVIGKKRVKEGIQLRESTIGILETVIQEEFLRTIHSLEDADPNEIYSVKTHASDPRFIIEVQGREFEGHDRRLGVTRGTVLAAFCFGPLRKLPQTQIETVFKVFYTFPVSSPEYNILYLGSPLYTALS